MCGPYEYIQEHAAGLVLQCYSYLLRVPTIVSTCTEELTYCTFVVCCNKSGHRTTSVQHADLPGQENCTRNEYSPDRSTCVC